SILTSRAATVRAVVGGLLVTVALLGVTQAYAHADRPPATGYAVAARTLPPGTVLDPGAVELVAIDLPPALADRAFRSADVLDGAVTLGPLAAGELVQLSQVLPADVAPAAGVDLSFPVAPERALGGRVQAGERLDLVATYPSEESQVVAADALLLDAVRSDDSLL